MLDNLNMLVGHVSIHLNNEGGVFAEDMVSYAVVSFGEYRLLD